MDEQLELAFLNAVESGDVEKSRALLAEHPDLIDIDFGACTALHAAAHAGNIPMMQLLLDSGSDVNVKEEFMPHRTPLEYSLHSDDPQVVRFLLDHGADPNHGRALISAIVGNRQHALELVKLLDHYGTDLHRVFLNEQTEPKRPMNALSTALDWGKTDVAAYLRSRGAVLPT